MPDWMPALIGIVCTTLGGVVVAAIGKLRTKPEQRLDALSGFKDLVQDLQEERDKAREQAAEAREQAAEVSRRNRIKAAYIERLRGWINDKRPPPPPEYPEGL